MTMEDIDIVIVVLVVIVKIINIKRSIAHYMDLKYYITVYQFY